jgi:hypothetical protein
MKKTITFAIAGAVAFATALGAASANIITIAGGLGSIDCSPSCEAFAFGAPALGMEPNAAGTLIDGVPATEQAWYYDGVPSSEQDEADRLSILITGSTGLFSGADGTRSLGSGGSDVISTLAEWVVMKLGNVVIFVHNNSGGLLEIDYTSFMGEGSGLSHYTEFGEVPNIPVPGAIWLMGAGLAGLGFAGRKKKRA